MSVILHVYSIFERNIRQTKEAVRVIPHDFFDDKFELVAGLLDESGVQQKFAFEAVLVDGCFEFALAGLVDPVHAPFEVAALAGEVGQSEVCIDVVGLLSDDLLVFVAAVVTLAVELVLDFVPVGEVELDADFESLKFANLLFATQFFVDGRQLLNRLECIFERLTGKIRLFLVLIRVRPDMGL